MNAEKIFSELKQKLEQAQAYFTLGNDDKAEEIIMSITDFEVDMVKETGKMFIEFAKLIKELKEDK